MNIAPLYDIDDIPTEPGLEKDMFYVSFGKPDRFKTPFFNWMIKTATASLDTGRKPIRNWKFLCILLPMYIYVRLFKLTINIWN